MGDGTFSGKIIEEIRSTLDIPIVMVDETYTTMEAEKRYYEEQGAGRGFSPLFTGNQRGLLMIMLQ